MTEVRAIVFQDRKTAGKALNDLDETAAPRWLHDVAVISRSRHGMVRVHSTWAQDDTDVTGVLGFGALTGGLIGAMTGPQGALAGAIGAGAGLLGLSASVAAGDERLKYFASQLKDNTSALILAADKPTSDAFVSAFRSLDGEVIETTLDEYDLKAVSEALKAARQRAP